LSTICALSFVGFCGIENIEKGNELGESVKNLPESHRRSRQLDCPLGTANTRIKTTLLFSIDHASSDPPRRSVALSIRILTRLFEAPFSRDGNSARDHHPRNDPFQTSRHIYQYLTDRGAAEMYN
jgi:hypothetical protein